MWHRFNVGLAVREGVSRCRDAVGTWRITHSRTSSESPEDRSSIQTDVATADSKSAANP